MARARSFEPTSFKSNPDLLALRPWVSSRTSLTWCVAICKQGYGDRLRPGCLQDGNQTEGEGTEHGAHLVATGVA